MIFVAVSIFSAVLDRAVFHSPKDEVTLPVGIEKTTRALADSSPGPSRLRIPVIGVDAKVEYVGITKKGNMATPTNFADVGWFKYGVIPGEKGSAVIAGHVDNGLALPSVFNKLDDLNKGDDVYVDTVTGESVHFVVVEKKVYDFDAYGGEVFGQDDGVYLKLVTCTGVWLDSEKTHDQRLVVTAKVVS